LIQGKEVLNLALLHVQRNALLVPAGGIHREPACCGICMDLALAEQGFAILTWVKVFHRTLETASERSMEEGLGTE
jgi:hypothetical protein